MDQSLLSHDTGTLNLLSYTNKSANHPACCRKQSRQHQTCQDMGSTESSESLQPCRPREAKTKTFSNSKHMQTRSLDDWWSNSCHIFALSSTQSNKKVLLGGHNSRHPIQSLGWSLQLTLLISDITSGQNFPDAAQKRCVFTYALGQQVCSFSFPHCEHVFLCCHLFTKEKRLKLGTE